MGSSSKVARSVSARGSWLVATTAGGIGAFMWWGLPGRVGGGGGGGVGTLRAPASAQGLVQAHMVGAEIGDGVGHALLRRELAALGVEHGLEVHETARIALPREQRRIAGRLRGKLQVREALAVALQRDQRILDILQRRQHGGLISELRLVQRCLLRAHLGEEGAAFEDRQRHAGCERAQDRRAARESAQRERCETERAADIEGGQARGVGLRHPRRGCRHLVFGGPHVRPLTQRLRRKAHRQIRRAPRESDPSPPASSTTRRAAGR